MSPTPVAAVEVSRPETHMSVLNIQEQLTGGESVYCINEAQMKRTQKMVLADDQSGAKIRETLASIEASMTRNERAALAFSIIEKLNNKSNHGLP